MYLTKMVVVTDGKGKKWPSGTTAALGNLYRQ